MATNYDHSYSSLATLVDPSIMVLPYTYCSVIAFTYLATSMADPSSITDLPFPYAYLATSMVDPYLATSMVDPYSFDEATKWLLQSLMLDDPIDLYTHLHGFFLRILIFSLSDIVYAK